MHTIRTRVLTGSAHCMCMHVCTTSIMAISQESSSQWLRKRFREGPVEGPDRKRVKFSDLQDSLSQANYNVSANEIAVLVKETFPNSVRKRLGGNRHTYVCGIEPIPQVDPLAIPDANTSTLALLEVERKRNRELMMKVNSLQAENESLTNRVAELEKQQSSSLSNLELEMDGLLNPRNDVFHGPNTIEHFKSFSVDNVLAEIRHQAPNVYHLLHRLARKRIDDSDENIDSLKPVVAICTLLKGRSVRILGVQLLLTFMLIARATSKQVKKKWANYETSIFIVYNKLYL